MAATTYDNPYIQRTGSGRIVYPSYKPQDFEGLLGPHARDQYNKAIDLYAADANEAAAAETAQRRAEQAARAMQSQQMGEQQRAASEAQQRQIGMDKLAQDEATNARYYREYVQPHEAALGREYEDTVRHETWAREDALRKAQQDRLDQILGTFQQSFGPSSGGPATSVPSAQPAVNAMARDTANNQAQQGQRRLQAELAARGMGGAGYEAGRTGDIVAQASQTEGKFKREQAIADQQRAQQVEDRNFAAQEAEKARRQQAQISLASLMFQRMY